MLLEVVARARQRLLWNALAFQFAVAVSVAFGLVVLLLLLGTDLLDWRWLIVLPAVSLATGIGISRRRVPGVYPTAQFLDRRLNLTDALSTALFFAGPHPARQCDEDLRRAQLAQASSIAAGLDLHQVIPIRMPRIAYFAVALAMMAAGLLHLRYRFDARLDLRPPMAGIIQQLLRDAQEELARLQEELQRKFAPDRSAREDAPKKSPDGRQGTEAADTFAEEQQGAQRASQSSGDPQEASKDGKSAKSESGGQQQQQDAGNQTSGSSGADSSLLSKFKDSMANLLSMAKPQPGGSGKEQPGSAQDGRPVDGRKQGGQSSASAIAEPGGDAAQPGSAQSAGAGQSADAAQNKQQGSGAGNTDGEKNIVSAEQLEAMGKLSMILGKRSRTVTGEFTAEAPQGPQRLRTGYVQRAAVHRDVQAKAERDEVPLAFQEYVQSYFDLVKKTGGASRRADRR